MSHTHNLICIRIQSTAAPVLVKCPYPSRHARGRCWRSQACVEVRGVVVPDLQRVCSGGWRRGGECMTLRVLCVAVWCEHGDA